jgi:hypothetical protein
MIATAGASREVYTYRQRKGSQEAINIWTRTILPGRIELTATKSATGEFDKMICNAVYTTTEWFYTDKKKNTSLHAVRENGSIRISGELKGKPINKTIGLETAAWYQFSEFAISYLLKTGQDPATYSLFWPNQMAFYVMKASRLGREKIRIDDKEIDTIKVKVSLSGFRSIFWSSYYWFRASDMLFVKYEGVNGLPGSATTIIELIER